MNTPTMMMPDPMAGYSAQNPEPFGASFSMSDYDPYNPWSELERIRQVVDSRRPAFIPLQTRMAEDRDLYNLDEFTGEAGFKDADGNQENWRDKGYRTYTSNDPRVFADKLMRMIASSKMNLQTTVTREMEDQRLINQTLKDFFMSAVKLADRKQIRWMKARIQAQIAYHLVVRGWYAGRCLLTRDMHGRTGVDLTVWDPMNVIWDVDSDGLLWACNLTYMRYADIKAQHPNIRPLTMKEYEDTDRILVYDYYDTEYNTVFADSMEIKARTRHGAQEVPVYLGPVGATPTVGNYEFDGGLKDVGESVFKANRDIYPKMNVMMSTMLEKVLQSRKPSYTYESQGGNRGTNRDPFREGSEIQIRQGERIDILKFPELAKELAPLFSALQGEGQRGSLPYVAYGDLPFQLSGYASNSLKQGMETTVTPLIEALENAYWQISHLLKAQYETGLFEPIPINGQMDQMAPQMISMADDLEIKFMANIPEDTAQKFAVAQMAREPGVNGVPMMPDTYVRQEILNVQDEDGMQDLIYAQQAQRLTPTAKMLTLMMAAEERGMPELAQEILMEYMVFRSQQQVALMQSQMQAGMLGMGMPMMGGPGQGPSDPFGGQGPGSEGPPGVDPAAAPQQVMGMPQPNPPQLQQAGSLAAPGQPRPGRQSAGPFA